jgi:phage gp36-like protein
MPVFGSPTQYATRADLTNLGLLAGALSSVPTATQDAALLAASGLADAALQSRYILPLTRWGQDLVRCVCIIAAYDLLTSRGYGPQQGVDDNIRKRYLDQLDWLKEVGKGNDTPSYVIDSSANGSGGSVSSPSADGSIVTSTDGGLQMTTSSVRGWTDRGAPSAPVDNGTGSL